MLNNLITSLAVNDTAEAIEDQVEKASGFVADMGDMIKAAMPSFVIALFMLIIGILISKLITKITGKALSRSNVDHAAKHFLISLIKILLYVVVIVMVLSFLKVPMSSILTVLGAAGLAVSLALQNCLSNLCGGFIILFSKPFSSGDIIEIDDSVGIVKTIGILYTKIMTFDGKTVFIPNGKVSEAKIVNYTETPTRRIDLAFEISYDSEYDKARAAILEVIAAHKLILKDPAPVVRMGAHKENSVSIDTLVWVKNEDYFSARYDMLENVRKTFAENGVVIPFNQVDVHISGKKEGN
ncbi:MAG: Small-conductance mechanosensitive channel [Firmicutes bacterium ADurb.BinA205]|nr:MAG: Small-conductance mechanosensitive channel [Firmicutes bacterium ADurb.BinA205]